MANKMFKKYIKICPSCKSRDVRFEASDAGMFDVCRKCGFRMNSFPEIEEPISKTR